MVAGEEIYYSIMKSKQKKKAKKILLGDSVANQLFRNSMNNGSLNSLACNQSISMAGHFILLNNYLNAGNKVDTVVLFFRPFSFQNNLDQEYTYHYFLKPFYIDEYKSTFTKKVTEQVKKIPYFQFSRLSYILTTNWAPNFISTDTNRFTFLSPISIDYLIKIKELSAQKNFKLVILSTPITLSKKPNIEKMDKNEISNTHLDVEFKNYFNSILYLNDSLFSDSIHLKHEYVDYYTNYYKNKLLQ